MFKTLVKINDRPAPFEKYTAADLWTDPHTSAQMLRYHLDAAVDVSSRKHAFIDRSVAWLATYFDITTKTGVLDLGCGPGLYTTRLAAATGAQVCGVDFSPRSIEHARTTASDQGLTIDHICADYLEFDTERRFDLITMIMCDFCALSPAQRAALLEKCHRLLTAGGALVLDVYTQTAYDRREETAGYEFNQLDGFWSAADYYCFVNTFKYEEVRVVLDKYTIVEAEGIREVYNWLQYFTPEELQADVAEKGFEVENFFADVAGSPFSGEAPELAVVARKPPTP
jgi:cyclopropane fatty-acyl-phospholipid synthase-like methyltransferase